MEVKEEEPQDRMTPLTKPAPIQRQPTFECPAEVKMSNYSHSPIKLEHSTPSPDLKAVINHGHS